MLLAIIMTKLLEAQTYSINNKVVFIKTTSFASDYKKLHHIINLLMQNRLSHRVLRIL